MRDYASLEPSVNMNPHNSEFHAYRQSSDDKVKNWYSASPIVFVEYIFHGVMQTILV